LLFESFLHFQIISALLSAAILLFWEYVKSSLLKQSFVSYYQTFAFPVISVFAFLMLTGSVYTSLQGAKQYHEQKSTVLSDFKATSENKLDSISSYYNNQILAAKTELKAYKESVMYKGKINPYAKATSATLTRLNNEISDLNNEKSKAIASLKSEIETGISHAKKKQNFNGFAFLALALLNEVLIIFCLWFLIFYKYKQVEESEVFTPRNENLSFSFSDLNRFAELVLRNSNQYALTNELEAQAPAKIGFNTTLSNHSVNQHLNSKEQEKQALSKADLTGLESDIKNGITDYRTLMKRNNVNVNTVKKYLTELT
jgi:hypothetical protein